MAADRDAAALVEPLLAWYAGTGRDLPWRRTTDPYAVLVSETMLQQTQVARVVPRYEAWLRRWPDAASLAAASGADVLGEWSGLGYNARALRLREAARIVMQHGWPVDEAGLRSLPGVGPYTAAAVAAFAYGQVAAAVDVNQTRVLRRWTGELLTDREVQARARTLVPEHAAGDWNHALMDLGATVCTARVARCDDCPVADACASRGVVDPEAERAAASATRPAERFEETQRYVRGRVVAALVDLGPADTPEVAARLPDGVEPSRLTAAIDGLIADGLVRRGADGLLRLVD